jgi:predicted O-linked N-acetylglucosamine transferase (SPINDLY family)
MSAANAIEAIERALDRGELERAEALAGAALSSDAGSTQAWHVAGRVALVAGALELALRRLTRALKLDVGNARAWCDLARLYLTVTRPDQALAAARRAVTVAPQDPYGWELAGAALDALGQHAEATEAFSAGLEHGGDSKLLVRRAAAWLAAGDAERAEADALAAREARPHDTDVAFVLGNVLAARGRHEQAVEAFRLVLDRAPDHAEVQMNLATSLDELGRWSEAARACEAALAADPNLTSALAQLVFLKRRLCEWAGLEALATRLRDAVRSGIKGVTPFSFLAEPATPAEQRRCAELWAQAKQAAVAVMPRAVVARAAQAEAAPAARKHGLRVGFVSSGFNNHPTALLIVELIERLQSSSLRTLAFATTPSDGGALRRRLRAAFDEFHEIDRLDYVGAAALIREREVDVLIDLRGYGGGSVTELFAMRPAPIQVNWLAYPGTSGAAFLDYLLADRTVVPDAQRAHYSEAVIRLPHCFQPSDATRRVGQPPSRRECGLPADGVVYASFNNSYKIAPAVFERWMAVLRAVPGAVLWLLSGRESGVVAANLRRAAEAAGVAPERLVFMAKLPHDEYLTRFRHVDLFLDTWPYNAHTTASDALWAGCPVLTLPGDTFAARVAASLVGTLGLDGLVARDADDYVARAIALGRDAGALAAVRQRLEQARRDSPLFDMARFARDFERAIGAMIECHRRGEAPADLDLEPR